jgi:CelD/BcsL family acetyltransferase involved in cellulose biosynthesis
VRIEVMDPLNDDRWGALVAAAAGASIFHHPRWLQLLHGQYGYELRAPCVLEGDRALAGLPVARITSVLTGRRLVALPFSDVCAPLLDADAPAQARAMLMDALEAEHRSSGLDLEVHAAVEDLPCGHTVPRFYHHVLELGPHAAELRMAKPQVKRGIAKAHREGLLVERDTSGWGLERFYDLHLRTRRRQGVPTQPKRFILAFSELFDAGLGFTLLARRRDRIVAAGVFLAFNQVLTYKYGASDERYLHTRPNNLLFAEAIRWAQHNGMREYDLGRTDLDNAGLASFKRSWGAAERRLAYTYTAGHDARATTGLAARVARQAIQRGPRSVGRAIGATMYKHYG